ncbi:MAG: hypothetical protein CME65_06910 [Halobacteriovoraceae bacterium]|nr:hypothetical protein [Halobacteriovoraceae bacterium]|tara:strand:+ start:2337 stop:2693 length:357 start_codon:yes stop_codon:yes gene_type:complete
MKTIALILTGFVALEHIGFLVLEMFLWNTPTGHKVFKLKPEFAEQTATLAANQGLYNGFLAAGIFWALFQGNSANQIFFLSCVLIAGLYGAYSASFNILYLQALPALIALIFVFLSQK